MAITAANVTYLGLNAPADKAQVFDWDDDRGTQTQRFVGYVSFTGDSGSGNSTTATVNYIDGTAALPFTPAMIIACRVGGTEATGVIDVISVVDAGNANKTATIKFSAAFTGTVIAGLKIYPA